MNFFNAGFRSILPLVSGIIPFGAVMGSAFADAGLVLWQAMLMNNLVYAGAAQLATVGLMKLNAAFLVVVATGLVINLRFLLYSAAMTPYLREAGWGTRLVCAFTLTDQSYAAMTAHQDSFRTNADGVRFYLGSAAGMFATWQSAVIAGYVFGNFAPASLSLDYAIPLSFVALLMPTLRTRGHRGVALFSALVSLLLHGLPMRTGLIATALLSVGLAWMIVRRRDLA